MSFVLTSEVVAGVDALLSVLQEHGVTTFSGYGIEVALPHQGKDSAPEKPIVNQGPPVYVPPAYRELPPEFIPVFPGSTGTPPPPRTSSAVPHSRETLEAGTAAVMDRAASLFVASGQQD